ncbi:MULTISPECIES: nuclear transport factor 2 family protein [unclassified Pseudomonas]|uniref:nuclear transport factor 2 family protein n=1 Tax=unclassified Pseudomonas TaxID=196821 RepID=UPI00249C15E5|nr:MULTISPECIES: nuclear transport factor 2 family protein [unclassified Pseudomonas]MDI3250056.1 nuclear transport factor 2 family protein [Pseudomonas sp. AL10]MDI3265860.1 nuclear transport factor 2 family protein [Pseudomonas sp. AL15]
MSEQRVEQQIQTLELRRRQAMVEGDMDFLESIYTRDLTYSHSDGKSDSKSSYLQGMREGVWRYRGFTSHDEQMRRVGECVVVTGLIDMDVVIRGEPMVLNSRYISVWKAGNNSWQMIAWQSTRHTHG